MARFESSVTINCPGDLIFDFLARPANLLHLTPPEAGLELVQYPERFERGSQFKFQMTGYGPVQHCLHEIIEFEEQRAIIEQQVQGPLQRYVHEHVVEQIDDGTARVIDRVEFGPPGGLLRFVVSEERILKSLQGAIEYRHRELLRHLDQSAVTGVDRATRER